MWNLDISWISAAYCNKVLNTERMVECWLVLARTKQITLFSHLNRAFVNFYHNCRYLTVSVCHMTSCKFSRCWLSSISTFFWENIHFTWLSLAFLFSLMCDLSIPLTCIDRIGNSQYSFSLLFLISLVENWKVMWGIELIEKLRQLKSIRK